MGQSLKDPLIKLRQLAQIVNDYDVFGTKNRNAEINSFITTIDHRSKNTYNTVSITYRDSKVRIVATTIRANGELGIVEIKAEASPKATSVIDFRNLNRRLSETLRF